MPSFTPTPPSLAECIAILEAVTMIESDQNAYPGSAADEFRVVLTFRRPLLRGSGQGSFADRPIPTYLFKEVIEQLKRLKHLDGIEAKYEKPTGATTAECIGFLRQQISHIADLTGRGGVYSAMATKMFGATIRHLEELHGRRQAADQKEETRRQQEKEKARQTKEDFIHQQEEKRKQQKTHYDPFGPNFNSGSWYKAYHEAFFGDSGPFANSFGNFDSAGPKQNPPPGPKASEKWWEVLAVQPDAKASDIKKAWRKLVSKYHSDKPENRTPENEEMMRRVNEAKDQGLAGL